MQRKSLAELGIHNYFYYPQGEYNAITDVSGVKVGHTTIISGDSIRTGVTVVSPSVDFDKVNLIAGGFALNANGEVTGLQYIFEEGRLISPIFLTNTLSVGDVFRAVVDYYKGRIALPVIGECWDGYLNDIEGRHVKKEHVFAALESLAGGFVRQGGVGAGTGMTSFGFKAGIGTASRVITLEGQHKKYTVGVLVNNNLGNEAGHHRYLRIAGVDVGKLLPVEPPVQPPETKNLSQQSSTIVVLATDIPLEHRQLNRIARHVVLGMGRVGIVSYTGSGDFIIAFSTANQVPERGTVKNWKMDLIEESQLDTVFEATIEATEEAFLNSLLFADTMQGKNGTTMQAIPIQAIVTHAKF